MLQEDKLLDIFQVMVREIKNAVLYKPWCSGYDGN